MAGVDSRFRAGHRVLDRELKHVRRIDPHPVAHGAAKQVDDGFAKGLPLDVPKGDVDTRHGLYDRAVATIIQRRLVHFLPKPGRVLRVFADQQVFQPRDQSVRVGRLDNRLGDRRGPVNLTPTDDAGIGRNPDQKRILRTVGPFLNDRQAQIQCFDIGNLHLASFTGAMPLWALRRRQRRSRPLSRRRRRPG